ncbi:glycine--tRNA ligase [Candidatus Gottesmanbacteria bacterium]|nr:glycine--tRNA ligase [Candidatus Gottesmanbacteria bacterium]
MDVLEKIVSLSKRRGFIFPGSEIYGGLGGTWDYGPVGCLLKKNVKDEWWKDMVSLRDDIVGVDAAIMMNPRAWEASGHVEAFVDPLVECKICHKRFREDHFKEFLKSVPVGVGNVAPKKEYQDLFICSNGKPHALEKLTEPRVFNLLVESLIGVTEPKEKIYLRGEITNGVHVNFKNVVDSTRIKIPFGIAQIGKAFRNEITPGNFTFRSREFEQMEVQYYIRPDEKEGEKWFQYWKDNRMEWYLKLGMKKENLRFRDHAPSERAHYARAATDIEYNAPWGWSEFMGIHHRGDWDLRRHQEYSGRDLRYKDLERNEEYIPWDIESSAGVDRSTLFFLIDSFVEEEKRIVLRLHPRLAPYKVAVFPLVANNAEIVTKAHTIYKNLKPFFSATWDDRGNIGKRYFAQDEIGTPFCATIDHQTLDDDAITIRDRDTMKQDRVKIPNIVNYIKDRLEK